MSTRCNIIIFNKGEYYSKSEEIIQVYHHCDGYPEGVGQELKDICKAYTGERTSDAFAEFLNKYDKAYEIEGRDATLHGDIEYLYLIEVTLIGTTLECHEVTSEFCGAYWEKHDRAPRPNDIVCSKLNKCIFSENYALPNPTEAVANMTPALFDDEELVAELRKRGYVGTLTKTVTVEL